MSRYGREPVLSPSSFFFSSASLFLDVILEEAGTQLPITKTPAYYTQDLPRLSSRTSGTTSSSRSSTAGQCSSTAPATASIALPNRTAGRGRGRRSFVFSAMWRLRAHLTRARPGGPGPRHTVPSGATCGGRASVVASRW